MSAPGRGRVKLWSVSRGSLVVSMPKLASPLPGSDTPPALTAPVNYIAPSISGSGIIGSALTRSSAGSWGGNPVPSITWTWQADGSVVQTGGTTYTPTSADAGKLITLVESAINSQGGPITAASNGIAAQAAVIGSIIYDTAIGNGVDAGGFTSLPLRAGASRFYVHPSGSDSNAGTDPALPLSTLTHAVSLVVQGRGDQVLLAEGTSYNEVIPWLAFKGGFSALYPTVISSYDPADPTNEDKIGMGHQRSGRPILTADIAAAAGAGQVSGSPFSYLAIKGLDLSPPNTTSQGLYFVGDGTGGGPSYLLIENNIFRHMTVSIDAANQPDIPFATQTIVLRNNSLFGGFNTVNGRSGGFYVGGGIDHVTVEWNTFWNTGFPVGGSRSDVPLYGTQSHSLYIQVDTTNVSINENLIIEPSADAVGMRGNGIVKGNVAIHSPGGLGTGPDNSHWSLATGNDIEMCYNLDIAGIPNGQPGGAPGNGFSTSKGNPGSRTHHNLVVKSENVAGLASVFSNVSYGTHTSYMEYDNNLIYQWTGSGWTIFTDNGTYSSYTLPYTTYNRNFWDDPTSGTNTSNSGLSFPNAYDLASLLLAEGYADLASFTAYVTEHPEAHLQQNLHSRAFTGYNRPASPADHDTVAPILTSPTASVTGGTVNIGVTTDEDGIIYSVATTSAAPPHVSQILVGVDASDAPGDAVGTPIVVSAPGAQTSSFPAPSSAGTYYVHFMQSDAEGNKSAPVTASFTVTSSSTTTWSPATDWTLTNANLTAERAANTNFWGLIFGSTAKQTGEFIVTVDAIGTGGFPAKIGMGLLDLANYPGFDAKGISYGSDGSITGVGAPGTYATYTTGDRIKVARTPTTVSFYKEIAGTFTLQATVDLGTFSSGDMNNVATYPAAANGNGTGTTLTIDASGW